jgi:hypothetical protein
MVIIDNMGGEEGMWKSNNAIFDSQINSINNRIYLLRTALKHALVSHFTAACHSACCSSSSLVCVLHCCASLVGACLFCQCWGAHPRPSLGEASPACGKPASCLGCCLWPAGTALLGTFQPSRLQSTFWTLTEWAMVNQVPGEFACSQCCEILSLLLLCLFTPPSWWLANSLALCHRLMSVTESIRYG